MCHKEKKKQDDFGIFEASLVLFSLGTLFIDIGTDAILVYKYIFDYGFITWGWLTLGLALVPSIVVHFFSLRWYIYDGESSAVIWLLHFSQLGILHRYLVVLKTGFEAAVMNHRDTFQRLYQQQRDISMLRLFESFMESAPQLLLQGYIIIVADDWHAWTGGICKYCLEKHGLLVECLMTSACFVSYWLSPPGLPCMGKILREIDFIGLGFMIFAGISAMASLVSLAWGIASYTRAMRNVRPEKKPISIAGMILTMLWRGGMMTGRMLALMMLAVALQSWTLLVICTHWLGMTIWIMHQETDFCLTKWEERIYNCIMGCVYCFCFFNLKEGKACVRMSLFYCLVFLENFLFCALYFKLVERKIWLEDVGATIMACSLLLGACSMLVYYRYFHPSGPIQVEFCCWRVKATPQKPQHNLQPSGLKFWSPPISRGDTLRPYDFKGSYIPTTRYQEESEPDGKVIHIPHATSFPNLECHQGSKASIQHATMYPGIQCASIYGSSLPNIHNSTPHSSSHFMGSMVPCWSEVILSSIPICSQPLRKSQTYAGFEEQLSDFLPNHEFETSVDESKCNYFLSGEEPSLDTSHTFEKISQKTMSLTCEEMKNEHNYALIDRTDQSNISKTGKVSQLIQQFETSVSFL